MMHSQPLASSTDESEIYYRIINQIIVDLPWAAYLKDKEGMYLYCNKPFAIKVQLQSIDDISGKSDEEMLWTNPAEEITKADVQIIKNGQPITFENKDVIVRKIPIRNNLDKVIGLLCIEQPKLDIEKKYQTLKEIVSVIPGHVYWKDCEGVVEGCNLQQAKDLGMNSPEEIVGKRMHQLIWPNQLEEERHLQAEKTKDIDESIISTNMTQSMEEFAYLPDGSEAYYWSTKSPLHDPQGHVIGVVGISVNINERKKLEVELSESKEKAEAANRAKTEFLENMRHDIRTPLTGIVGFSELLKSESNEPRIKEYADNLVASSHALLDLMDEVLEAVRVSSGEIPMLKRKFNLAQTLEQIVDLYQARAHEKKLNLSLTLDSKLPHFIIGDKIRVHRIVLELVGNALNFTDVGHVTISVKLAKREQRNLVIKITVTDTGMGIPKDKQQEIYVQFKRLTPSYKGIYKGAGLGLYVVKQFIDELGGEIYVESESHLGTCFTCLIPLQESLLDDASGIDTVEDLKTEKPYMTPMTHQLSPSLSNTKDTNATTHVLVVEDNFIAQTVARALLSALSCHVDIASTGNEAIAFFKKNHYDLILMDIGLGEGMDGYEVTHHIRNQQDKTNHTPIIALTAHAGDDNKQRCIEAGMDAVLTKPLTQAHAADIIKTFIPERRIPSTNITPLRLDLPDQDDELFQLEQFALLDYEQALKNCGNNPTMVVDMLTLMITKEVPTDLERMKNAFEIQDYPLIEKLMHKIKGGAVYVGTTRMKYACQYVERYWKTGERVLFDKLYHQAVKTIEESCSYIADWLDKQGNP